MVISWPCFAMATPPAEESASLRSAARGEKSKSRRSSTKVTKNTEREFTPRREGAKNAKEMNQWFDRSASFAFFVLYPYFSSE